MEQTGEGQSQKKPVTETQTTSREEIRKSVQDAVEADLKQAGISEMRTSTPEQKTSDQPVLTDQHKSVMRQPTAEPSPLTFEQIMSGVGNSKKDDSPKS